MALTIREMTEQMQQRECSPYATLAQNSKGRRQEEEPCSVRTAFHRDRDRILHSNAFRRLKHKTQVFIAKEGDHYRERMTHTLEVTQIARTIARGLRLNEDLTEAIALGHDLGHTPFGHTGEKVLNDISLCKFAHNEQSLRVVDKLERLNLTFEVRDGILNHRSACQPCTPEGQIVRMADKIAYINHDIDDTIRSGELSEADLPKACVQVLGHSRSERINTMVIDILEHTREDKITMSEEVSQATQELRAFLFRNVYYSHNVGEQGKKAANVVRLLFSYYKENPAALPARYQEIAREESLDRAVCDYIAGMTDNYAISLFSALYVPGVEMWK